MGKNFDNIIKDLEKLGYHVFVDNNGEIDIKKIKGQKQVQKNPLLMNDHNYESKTK